MRQLLEMERTSKWNAAHGSRDTNCLWRFYLKNTFKANRLFFCHGCRDWFDNNDQASGKLFETLILPDKTLAFVVLHLHQYIHILFNAMIEQMYSCLSQPSCFSMVPFGHCRSEWPCLCLQRADDGVCDVGAWSREKQRHVWIQNAISRLHTVKLIHHLSAGVQVRRTARMEIGHYSMFF